MATASTTHKQTAQDRPSAPEPLSGSDMSVASGTHKRTTPDELVAEPSAPRVAPSRDFVSTDEAAAASSSAAPPLAKRARDSDPVQTTAAAFCPPLPSGVQPQGKIYRIVQRRGKPEREQTLTPERACVSDHERDLIQHRPQSRSASREPGEVSGSDGDGAEAVARGSPQSDSGTPHDPVGFRRRELFMRYRQCIDTLEGYYGTICFRYGKQDRDELLSKLHHAKELIPALVRAYEHNGGRCYLTGLQLEAKARDKGASEDRRVARFMCLDGLEYSPDNVIPVARCVSQVCSRTNAQKLVFIANETARFVEFCRRNAGRDHCAILAEWDALEPPGYIASLVNATLPDRDQYFVRKMLDSQLRSHEREDFLAGRKTSRQVTYSAQMVDELVLMYKRQSGRCWYTGFPICDNRCNLDMFCLSVDRIDNAVPHTPGNVRLTSRWYNTARNNESPESVLRTLSEIATYSPSFNSVLQRLPQTFHSQ